MGRIIIDDEKGILLEGNVTQEFVRQAIGGLNNYFEQTMQQVLLNKEPEEGEMTEIPPMLGPEEVKGVGLEIPEEEKSDE